MELVIRVITPDDSNTTPTRLTLEQSCVSESPIVLPCVTTLDLKEPYLNLSQNVNRKIERISRRSVVKYVS